MSDLRETRRIQILQAACLEFSEKGFDGARIEQIAQRAGIGKSTVYEYFPSKLELLEGAADWMFDRVAGDVTAIMGSALPFADKTYEYLIYICKIMHEFGQGMLYIHGTSQPTLAITRRLANRFFGVISQAMAGAVQEAKRAGELRDDVSAAALSRLVCYLPSPALAEEIAAGNTEAADEMIELLMRGAGRK